MHGGSRRAHRDRESPVDLDLDAPVHALAGGAGVVGGVVASRLVRGPNAGRIDTGADQISTHSKGALAGDAAFHRRIGDVGDHTERRVVGEERGGAVFGASFGRYGRLRVRAVQTNSRVAPVKPGRNGVGGSANVGVEREDSPLPVEQIERLEGAEGVRIGLDAAILRARSICTPPRPESMMPQWTPAGPGAALGRALE